MKHVHHKRRVFGKRKAFTTVELLVSTVLASILMVALLGVLRGVRMQAEAMESLGTNPAWHATLDRVFHDDFANSTHCRFDGNSLTLTGFAGRQLESMAATWTPAIISYEIVRRDEFGWLVRSEKRIDGNGAILGERKELVLSGVDSIRLLTDSGSSQSDGRNQAGLPPSRAEIRIEDGLRVEFWGKQETTAEPNEKEPVYACHLRRY